MFAKGLNRISRYFQCRPPRRHRSDSDWTSMYNMPEPAFPGQKIGRLCDWVFGKADRLFRGSQRCFWADERGLTTCGSLEEPANMMEWDLHQQVSDIAWTDVQAVLRLIVPGFARRYAWKLYNKLTLYFIADATCDDEMERMHRIIAFPGYREKILSIAAEARFRIPVKCVSFKSWWIRFIHRLSALLKARPIEKTYYLLGDFAPGNPSPFNDSHSGTTWGPAPSNLKSTVAFHKRI